MIKYSSFSFRPSGKNVLIMCVSHFSNTITFQSSIPLKQSRNDTVGRKRFKATLLDIVQNHLLPTVLQYYNALMFGCLALFHK